MASMKSVRPYSTQFLGLNKPQNSTLREAFPTNVLPSQRYIVFTSRHAKLTCPVYFLNGACVLLKFTYNARACRN
jgi:hypothetical protein